MEYKFVFEEDEEAKVTEEDIAAVENKYNIQFPEVLRRYYLEHNYAEIQLCSLEINGNVYEVADVLPIVHGDCTFELVRDLDQNSGYVPEDFYPFANDQGGNFYYWQKDTEKVFVQYTEDEEELNNPICVCTSIDMFFQMMSESF